MSEKNCGSCCHYDSIHELCPLFTLDQSFGPYYLKRLPASPACDSNYTQKLEITVVPHPHDLTPDLNTPPIIT